MTGTAEDLLKATARSFYLTLRVLPARVRPQICLAYLLARTTDTIADTEIIPQSHRLDALQGLRARILGETSAPLKYDELIRQQASPAEKLLLEKVEDSLTALMAISAADRELIRQVLATITSGQELDVRRFANAAPGKITALQTPAELDDYTYRVAGCVGEFWTRLCRAHLFPNAKLDAEQLVANGIRFGKGLQLVNILRDLPVDLRNGRCYLPQEKLTPGQLTPENLLRPENGERFLAVYQAQLDLAEAHLGAGWRYTNSLPFGQFRVRLACAWPVLLGIKTIQALRAASLDELQRRVKVPRGKVYAMMAHTALVCPMPWLWRKLYVPAAKAVASGGKLA